MTTAGTTSRRMTCRKNDGPPGSVCRDRKSGRSPAFGNRLGQGLLTEHSIRSHTAPAGPPLWRTAGAVLFWGGSTGVCRARPWRPAGGRGNRIFAGGDAGWAVPDLEGYLLLKPAMHPSVGSAAITGLRSPHHAAHAEACLHSATAAPAPSRFLRRRRRSTPQPLTGEPFKRQRPAKPPLQGEVPPQAAEGCGAWPCHYPFGPPQPLRRGRYFASARKFAPSQGPRDDASIVPYGRRAKPCRGLEDVRRPLRCRSAKTAPHRGFGCGVVLLGCGRAVWGVSGRRIPGCLSPKQRLPV